MKFRIERGKTYRITRYSDRRLRARDPETGEFLHMDGTGRTPTDTYSWLGTRTQFRTLLERMPDSAAHSMVLVYAEDTRVMV